MNKKLIITPEILERVIYGMENQKEQLFLDPTNGTLSPVRTTETPVSTVDKPTDTAEKPTDTAENPVSTVDKPAGTAEKLIPMPPWDSNSGYRLMDRFITTLSDKILAHRLKDVLSGSGSFRRFKEVLAERPLHQRLWREFKKRAMQQVAYSWLSRWSDALELEDLPAEPEDFEDLAAMDFALRNPTTEKEMELITKWDMESWKERFPDISELQRENAVFRERCMDEDSAMDKMAPEDVILAETIENKFAGFGWMPVQFGEGWLLQLYVLPEFRGMGLGTLLLEHCISMAKMRGAVRLGIFQTESANSLTDWLERNGFRREVVAWTIMKGYDKN